MQSTNTTNPSGLGRSAIVSFRSPLEGMRSMRTQREDQLHEQLIAALVVCVFRKTIFSAKLAEFAWPVGKSCSRAFVGQVVELAAVRPVEAPAGEPPAPKLIVTGCIPAECPLLAR